MQYNINRLSKIKNIRLLVLTVKNTDASKSATENMSPLLLRWIWRDRTESHVLSMCLNHPGSLYKVVNCIALTNKQSLSLWTHVCSILVWVSSREAENHSRWSRSRCRVSAEPRAGPGRPGCQTHYCLWSWRWPCLPYLWQGEQHCQGLCAVSRRVNHETLHPLTALLLRFTQVWIPTSCKCEGLF